MWITQAQTAFICDACSSSAAADDLLNNVINSVTGVAATATSFGLPAAGSVPLNLNLLGAQFLNFFIGDFYDSTVSNYNVRLPICLLHATWFPL